MSPPKPAALPELSRDEVRDLLLTEKAKAGSWRRLSKIIDCRPELLSEAGGGGHIPLAVADHFGLERVEVRTITYRKKK